jgi:hypothetical protein
MIRYISLLLFIGLVFWSCEEELEKPAEVLEGWCVDPNAYNCYLNSNEYETWCDSTKSQVDSLILNDLIDKPDFYTCEFCTDSFPEEECCGREEAINYNPEFASYWDTLYCIYSDTTNL